jgi:hypothetical protein
MFANQGLWLHHINRNRLNRIAKGILHSFLQDHRILVCTLLTDTSYRIRHSNVSIILSLVDRIAVNSLYQLFYQISIDLWYLLFLK